MDIMTAISERRSIRKFTSAEISREIIEKIIESGIKAPSSKNSQPWRFYVIEGEIKAELIKILKRRHEVLQKTTFHWCCNRKHGPGSRFIWSWFVMD